MHAEHPCLCHQHTEIMVLRVLVHIFLSVFYVTMRYRKAVQGPSMYIVPRSVPCIGTLVPLSLLSTMESWPPWPYVWPQAPLYRTPGGLDCPLPTHYVCRGLSRQDGNNSMGKSCPWHRLLLNAVTNYLPWASPWEATETRGKLDRLPAELGLRVKWGRAASFLGRWLKTVRPSSVHTLIPNCLFRDSK